MALMVVLMGVLGPIGLACGSALRLQSVTPLSQICTSASDWKNFSSTFAQSSRLPRQLGGKESVVFCLVPDLSRKVNWPTEYLERLVNSDGYLLITDAGSVMVIASRRRGFFNAIPDLPISRSRESGGSHYHYELRIPRHQLRGLHVVMRGQSINALKLLVDKASLARINTLVLQLTDQVRFDSIPSIAAANALSKADFGRLLDYAKTLDIDVVPAVALLSHQENFLKDQFPNLMFNSRTYNPANAELRELVYAYLSELIALSQPKAIMIGHDEIAGWHQQHKINGHLLVGEDILPAALFTQSVADISQFLRERNIETWMWGDMLLSPGAFPNMNQDYLHGRAGFAGMLRSIPHDVVIADWHYDEEQPSFPSVDFLIGQGFVVIGSTWKMSATTKNFSAYAKHFEQVKGMLATTWFHVQRGDADIVDKIITDSGQSFWGDPDETPSFKR